LHTFTWSYGGYKVQLAATFTDWKRVNLDYNNYDGTHSIEFKLEANKGYQYKFIIDDDWRCDEQQPMVKDDFGNTNNYIFLTN